MDWYWRFCLGLPCRPEDARTIRRHFPELLDRDWDTGDLDFAYLFYRLHRRHASCKEFQTWISEPQSDERARPSPGDDCPAARCPLKDERTTSSSPAKGGFFLDLIIGGGPERKEPKAAFLNLVRKHHKKTTAKQVIITDPYFLSDTGEDGESGGYVNAVEYLQALSLSESSTFTLTTNPSPRRFSEEAKRVFDRVITDAFPRASIETYRSEYKFHDRLYLVKDSLGALSGVFGPSLNGLSTDAIVLMGEINDDQALKVLNNWLG